MHEVRRDDKLPLYLQIKNQLLANIRAGVYAPGTLLKTEMELCAAYQVSRVTIRKALKALVDEGWLERRSGSGTFIRNARERKERTDNLLGLVVPRIQVELVGTIIAGFESSALEQGWLTVLCASDDDPDLEARSIDALVDSGVRGLSVIACDGSFLSSRENRIHEDGVPLVLIDREPALTIGYDYIGSDNFGGAYAAVRHLYNQGFRTIAFVAYRSDMSSIKERIEGYLQAVKDFSLRSFHRISNESQEEKHFYKHERRLFIEDLKDHIKELKPYIPFGILAVNDFIALDCIRVLTEEGLIVGKEAAVIGFDNIAEGAFVTPPLTTVIQNARLLGQNAATQLIRRVSNRESQFSRIVLPTQIMLRKSCGE